MANYSPVSETKYEGLNRTVVLGLSTLLLLLGVSMVIAQCAILDLENMGPSTPSAIGFFVPQMMTIGTNVLVALVGVAGIFSTFNTSHGKVKLFAGLAIAVCVIVILVMLITLAIYLFVALVNEAVFEQKDASGYTANEVIDKLKKQTADVANGEFNLDRDKAFQGIESWRAALAMFKATLIIYGIQIILLIVSAVMGHKAMGACCFTKRSQRA
jgi:hypothetical protein